VLAALDGVAASTGSACHAGSVELSPVLAAMGVPPQVGMGAVRLTLGRPTTEAEIDHVLTLVEESAHRRNSDSGTGSGRPLRSASGR
jgi:cysteine desulfurase